MKRITNTPNATPSVMDDDWERGGRDVHIQPLHPERRVICRPQQRLKFSGATPDHLRGTAGDGIPAAWRGRERVRAKARRVAQRLLSLQFYGRLVRRIRQPTRVLVARMAYTAAGRPARNQPPPSILNRRGRCSGCSRCSTLWNPLWGFGVQFGSRVAFIPGALSAHDRTHGRMLRKQTGE